MESVTATGDAQSRTLAVEVGARILRAQLDEQARHAAQVLHVLPPPVSTEPGRGARIDTYA